MLVLGTTKLKNNNTMADEKRFTIDNADKFGKHYSESGFWDKLKSLAGKAGRKVAYPSLLLYFVLISRDVPVKYKGIIIGALGYLIFPLDLIPDFIPVAGLTDDLAALLAAVQTVSECVTPEIEQQAKAKLEELFGENCG